MDRTLGTTGLRLRSMLQGLEAEPAVSRLVHPGHHPNASCCPWPVHARPHKHKDPTSWYSGPVTGDSRNHLGHPVWVCGAVPLGSK